MKPGATYGTLLTLLALLACDGATEPTRMGGITLNIVASEDSAEIVQEPVTGIRVWLSGPGVNLGSYTLPQQPDGFYTMTIDDLEAGEYRVGFEGLLGPDVAYFGGADRVTVVAGQNTLVDISYGVFVVNLDSTPDTTTAFLFELSWPSVMGAELYRVEWTADSTFVNGLNTLDVSSASAILEVDSLDQYYLRVRPINEYESVGLAATAAVVVVADTVGMPQPATARVVDLSYIPGDTTHTAGVLNIPTPAEVDWFGFESCPGDTVAVETYAYRLDPSSRLDTYLSLYAADQNGAIDSLVAESDNVSDTTDSRVGPLVLDGRDYLFSVESVLGTVGHYEVTITVKPGVNNQRPGCVAGASATR